MEEPAEVGATVALPGFAFEWLRTMGKAVIRTAASLLGFRGSGRGSGVTGAGAFNAEFGANHQVVSHDCEATDRTGGRGKVAARVEFVSPEVFVRPGNGNGSVRKETGDIPSANAFTGLAVADSALNLCGLDVAIRSHPVEKLQLPAPGSDPRRGTLHQIRLLRDAEAVESRPIF